MFVPVLLVSGYADLDSTPGDLRRLAKPFRREELKAHMAALTDAATLASPYSG